MKNKISGTDENEKYNIKDLQEKRKTQIKKKDSLLDFEVKKRKTSIENPLDLQEVKELKKEEFYDLLDIDPSSRTDYQNNMLASYMIKKNILDILKRDKTSDLNFNLLAIHLAQNLKIKVLKKDEILFRIDDMGDNFYLILEGNICVLKPSKKRVLIMQMEFLEILRGLHKKNEKYIVNQIIKNNYELICFQSYEQFLKYELILIKIKIAKELFNFDITENKINGKKDINGKNVNIESNNKQICLKDLNIFDKETINSISKNKNIYSLCKFFQEEILTYDTQTLETNRSDNQNNQNINKLSNNSPKKRKSSHNENLNIHKKVEDKEPEKLKNKNIVSINSEEISKSSNFQNLDMQNQNNELNNLNNFLYKFNYFYDSDVTLRHLEKLTSERLIELFNFHNISPKEFDLDIERLPFGKKAMVFKMIVEKLILDIEEEDIYFKYSQIFDDSPELKQFTIFEYEEFIHLRTGDFFGDFALDSEKKKRTATILSDTQTYLGYLSNEVYQKYIFQEKHKIRQKDVKFLNSICLFSSIKSIHFEKTYFPDFAPHDYLKYATIFKQGDPCNKMTIVKEGLINLVFQGSLFDLDNSIKIIIEKAQELNYFSIGKAFKYTNLFCDGLRIQNKNQDYLDTLKKKKDHFLVTLGEKQFCGLEFILLGMNHLYKIVSNSEKCKVFFIDKDRLEVIVNSYKEIKNEYKNLGVKKIKLLIKRIYSIKNCYLDMLEKNIETLKTNIKQKDMTSKFNTDKYSIKSSLNEFNQLNNPTFFNNRENYLEKQNNIYNDYKKISRNLNDFKNSEVLDSRTLNNDSNWDNSSKVNMASSNSLYSLNKINFNTDSKNYTKSYFSQDNSAFKENKNDVIKSSSSVFNEIDNGSNYPKINEKGSTNFKKNNSFVNNINSNASNNPGIRINYQYFSNNENINNKSGKAIPKISVFNNTKSGNNDKFISSDKEFTPNKLNSEGIKNMKQISYFKLKKGENCNNENQLNNNLPKKVKINPRSNSDSEYSKGAKNVIKKESLITQRNFNDKEENISDYQVNQPYNMSENSFGKFRVTYPGLKINLNFINETEKSNNKEILNKIPFKVEDCNINVIKENEEEYSNNISDRCFLKEKSLKNQRNSISIKNIIKYKIEGDNILPSQKNSFNSKLNMEIKEETSLKDDPSNILEEKYEKIKYSENEIQNVNLLEKKCFTQKNIIDISNENNNNLFIIEDNIKKNKKSNSFSKDNLINLNKNLGNNKFRKNKALNFDHSNDSIVYSDNENKNNNLINNKNKVDNINYLITDKIATNINCFYPNNKQKQNKHLKNINSDNHSKENNPNFKKTSQTDFYEYCETIKKQKNIEHNNLNNINNSDSECSSIINNNNLNPDITLRNNTSKINKKINDFSKGNNLSSKFVNSFNYPIEKIEKNLLPKIENNYKNLISKEKINKSLFTQSKKLTVKDEYLNTNPPQARLLEENIDSDNNHINNIIAEKSNEKFIKSSINKKYFDTIYSHFTNFTPLFLGNNKRYEHLLKQYLIKEERNKAINSLSNILDNNDLNKMQNKKTSIDKSFDGDETLDKDEIKNVHYNPNINNQNNIYLSTYGKFKAYDPKGLIFSMQSSYKKLSSINSIKHIKNKSQYLINNVDTNPNNLGFKLNHITNNLRNHFDSKSDYSNDNIINKKIKIKDTFNENKPHEKEHNYKLERAKDGIYEKEINKILNYSLEKLKKLRIQDDSRNLNICDNKFLKNSYEESFDDQIIKSKSLQFKGLANKTKKNYPFYKNNNKRNTANILNGSVNHVSNLKIHRE